MRHQKSGRRFNRDTDARKALMRNLCTSLLESGRITTTEARAKELRRWVERLITTAKDQDANARRRVSAEGSKPDVGMEPRRLVAAVNAGLRRAVAGWSGEVVEEDFHARHSARRRRYRYRFLDRPARPALERGRCWHVRGALDVDAMSLAARTLVGKHDWTTFCSASEPADTRVREMHSASVRRRGDLVELELVAEGFLRGMVRSIAGALAEVGRGERPHEWVGEILRARDRRRAPRTAPAGGLTLMEVIY